MPRFAIDKATVRNKLEPRREPYWGAPVERGLFVGFRRLVMGGNWVARLRTPEGKQAYHALGPVSAANDYEHAKREARRWRKAVEVGVDTGAVDTVAETCAAYVAALRKDGREKAAADAERRFARIVDRDPLGKVQLAHLRERHIELWRDRLEAGKLAQLPSKRGRPRSSKPMSPSAFKRNLTALKAALNHAVRKRYVVPEKAHEWHLVQPVRDADGRRDLYLDRTQRRALLDAAEGPLRDLLECVALTGCRPGDPPAALRRDYDARSALVTFVTKGKKRTIPLSPAAKALFDRLARSKTPKAHLFTREGGVPWQPQDWRSGVKEAATKANLPPETVVYTLRHGWITDAIVGGMDLLTVSRLVGTSLAMIEKHYGHLVESGARDKLASLEFA